MRAMTSQRLASRRCAVPPSARSDLQRHQQMRKCTLRLCCLGVLLTMAFVGSAWPRDGSVHELIEAAGLITIVVAVAGRTWCSLYIAGRKRVELVRTGPYSLCRHPLYSFSVLGACGAGAQSGSLLLALAAGGATALVLWRTALHEEHYLRATFGRAYQRALGATPRFRPDFSRWRDDELLTCRPRQVFRTMRDGLAFFLAAPAFEAIKIAQEAGWLAPVSYLV